MGEETLETTGRVGGGDAGLEGDELEDVAAVQRQVGDFAGAESVREAAFFGLNQRGVGVTSMVSVTLPICRTTVRLLTTFTLTTRLSLTAKS